MNLTKFCSQGQIITYNPFPLDPSTVLNNVKQEAQCQLGVDNASVIPPSRPLLPVSSWSICQHCPSWGLGISLPPFPQAFDGLTIFISQRFNSFQC